MSLIYRAAWFARHAHAGQKRKFTGARYIRHPIRVAQRVKVLTGSTPEMVAAALLHDVLEDCDVRREHIDKAFGDPVFSMVSDLTNPSTWSTAPRAERKAMDREHLESVSFEVKRIKFCDRIDNLLEVRTAPRGWLHKYLAESRLLADVLRPADEDLYAELMQIIRIEESRIDGRA